LEYSKAKLKSNGDRASACFKTFLIGNMSDKVLAYSHSAIRFSQTHSYKSYQFHGNNKLNENIIQDFVPK